MPSDPGALLDVVCWRAVMVSSREGRSARVSFLFSCGRAAIASLEVDDSLFSNLSKCSAQRVRMSALSVRRVV